VHGRNLAGVLGGKDRIDAGGYGGGRQQLDRLGGRGEDPFAPDGVAGLGGGAVHAHLDGHLAARCQPGNPLGVEEGPVGGDAGHDPLCMACSQDLFEIGAHERLAAAEIHLEDPGLVQLLHQVQGLGRAELALGGLSGGGEAVGAAQVAG